MSQQTSAATARREPPDEKMSYKAFLEWLDEDTVAEWIDGEIVIASPASDRHQDLVRFLTALLSFYVESEGLGVNRLAPFQMKLENGREPDLLFLANENLERLRETYLDGPADMVVEIVSPESAARDRGEKFYEYEAGGVPEYWLIDPLRERAEFYQMVGDRYQMAAIDANGVYRSAALPEFWLRVGWLWARPLPPLVKVLGEIGVLPRGAPDATGGDAGPSE
ncbi:MAG: Uma2 family endonuclease [Candidatus Promineifilaceae bacterium]|nr:Uma2 family endonuclease [Candidatus Promineifilaceae bacterium]